MKRVLMTLVVGLWVGACGGVMTEEEATPLEETRQEARCGFCGDDFCCAEMETTANCPADCGQPECGDGVCNTNESSTTCPYDCGPVTVCGDGVCNGGETSANCPTDCGYQPVCGDGVCSSGEGNLSCPEDCPCNLLRCW